MKHEDVGSPRWGSGCASCWPPFLSLCPSVWLLWVALTRLAGFTFEPYALVDPMAIMGHVLDTIVISHDVEGASYEESDDA
jgi:hypothetical protein